MNFTDLLSKIKSIDEGEQMTPPVQAPELPSGDDSFLVGEKGVEESGNVQISMSMQDLLALMGKMDHGHGDEVVVGMEEAGEDGGFEDATTVPDPATAGVSAVTPTGNDLASKGGEAEKVNGGGNPMNVDEALVARLTQQYEAIKEGKKPDFLDMDKDGNKKESMKKALKDKQK